MAVLDLVGPSVEREVHNTVLRDAVLHVPSARAVSASSYVKVQVGIRDANGTSWIGSWSQREKSIAAGDPVSVLDSDRPGMRLKERTSLVVRVTTTGTPASLEGSEVDFRLGLVGGREGIAKPLVASGVTTPAIRSIERQINEGGLSEWSESVQLHDPDGTVTEPAFQAENSYTTTDKTIVAAAGATASDVSITFTKPSWATTGYVNVTAFVDALGAGGGVGALDIHDGSAAHNTIQFSIAATFATSSGTGYAGEITETTTFTLRGTATTANMTLQESAIYGTCSWA